MKAVALTIEALALLNNKERKKEVQNGTLANFSLQLELPYGSGLQKGIASHTNSRLDTF